MKRRTFIKRTSFFAVAVSTTGFIRFDGRSYVGDCETTTDIIGPFYRPNAPVRNDLTIKGASGEIVTLSGKIFHKDCVTPIGNAAIDIWHCSHEMEYDNTSPEFRYRGKTFTDKNGSYFFRTIIPVPYHTSENQWRPAHYHLLISAPLYQDLVTQIYFAGDPHIADDEYASSPQAKKRTLHIDKTRNGEKVVTFDIVMSEKIPADAAVINRLTGTYSDIDKKQPDVGFYRNANQLWVTWNGEHYDLEYISNNTFKSYGEEVYANFEILGDGSIRVTVTQNNTGSPKQTIFTGLKVKQ